MIDWSVSDAALLTIIAASVASAMLLAPLMVARPPSAPNLLSSQRWRDALHYLAEEVSRVHPHPFHGVTRQQFDAAVAQVDAKIPALSDHEIELELVRLVGMLGEGHSRTDVSDLRLNRGA